MILELYASILRGLFLFRISLVCRISFAETFHPASKQPSILREFVPPHPAKHTPSLRDDCLQIPLHPQHEHQTARPTFKDPAHVSHAASCPAAQRMPALDSAWDLVSAFDPRPLHELGYSSDEEYQERALTFIRSTSAPGYVVIMAFELIIRNWAG